MEEQTDKRTNSQAGRTISTQLVVLRSILLLSILSILISNYALSFHFSLLASGLKKAVKNSCS